jgi:hypothetical protein
MFKYHRISEILPAKFAFKLQECLAAGWELVELKIDRHSGFALLVAEFKRYEPKFLKFKSYISDHCYFTSRDWKVGDEMNLPTPFGTCVFKITKLTPDRIDWLSGTLLTSFEKEGNMWKWDRCLIDVKGIAQVQFI